jgi:hypothetical protein
MLKLLVHTSLALALLTQQLQMAVVCVAFKMEQNYLIQNSCINRSNPNSKCKAHCQLSKRMGEQEKQEQENKILLKEESEFVARVEKVSLNVLELMEKKNVWIKVKDEKLRTGVFCKLIQPPENLRLS